MEKPTVGLLKELFKPIAHVPDEELQYLIDNSNHRIIKEDDFIFEAEKPSDEMIFILSGKFRVYSTQNNQRRNFTTVEGGSISGILPYSRLKVARGYGQAMSDSEVLAFHRDKMQDLILNNYNLTEALVHHMSSRIREFTTFQQQNEKMMALGKLSAGLAHELNNPASAIVRSSKELQKHLANIPVNFKKVISIQMSEQEVDDVNDLLFGKIGAQADVKKMSLMERQQLEDDLIDCLEDKGVEDGFEIAENLIDFGFTCGELDMIYDRTSDTHFAPVMKWVNDNLTTERMVREIEDASSRIAGLISSVKNFTHMDRTQDKIKADIHEGIDNTLVMLNHKLKGKVNVVKNYAEDVPHAKILVSQLNQVWTNLLDNAIDALEGGEDATIEIKTSKDKAFVQIMIIDNGTGIPEDVQNKIFDPFFTTKEIGKGTGLGLDVVMNIIKAHNGTIKVNSVPGRTEFEVCIPIE